MRNAKKTERDDMYTLYSTLRSYGIIRGGLMWLKQTILVSINHINHNMVIKAIHRYNYTPTLQ